MPVLLAAALGAGMLGALPTQAMAAPTAVQAEGGGGTENDGRSAAIQAAKDSGKPVVVDALTSEVSQTLANPDGSFTLAQNHAPVRVKKGGAWTPIDADLVRGANGIIQPKATLADVRLSDGGTGPFLTTADGDTSIALTLPAGMSLPKPTLRGNQATYPEVLPGIDLQVAVDGTGFNQALVVKNAMAATNPALSSLSFATTSKGLAFGSTPEGGAAAKNAEGETVFTAAAPRMWDSREVIPGAQESDGTSQQSTVTAPGDRARQENIPLSASGSTLRITPDQDLLHGAGTVFPVFIDPDFHNNLQHHAELWKSKGLFVDGNGYVGTDTSVMRAGLDPDGSGVIHSFYQFDAAGVRGKHILSSYLVVNQTHTYAQSNSVCTANPLVASFANAFPSSGSWGSEPTDDQTLPSASPMNCSGGTGNGIGIKYDATKASAKWAANNWPTIVIKVRGGDESSYNSWRKLDLAPTLYTTYNTLPDTPNLAAMSEIPNPVTADGAVISNCTSVGWIGAVNAATPVRLRSQVTDPDRTGVKGVFSLWDKSNNGAAVLDRVGGSWVESGGSSEVSAGVLADGHIYGWGLTVTDGTDSTGNSPSCTFGVDGTPPTVPTVTSTDFPASGATTGTEKHAGDTGTFQLTSTDTGAGLRGYTYSLNTPVPQSGGTFLAATASTPVTVQIPHWGTNVLYVTAVDKAGNTSPAQSYSFYVPDSPNSASPKLGDLTGDKIPDLLTTDTAGNLRLFSGTADPATGGVIASSGATDSPESDGWSGYLLAHRGSMTGKNVDDLYVHKPNSPNLYLYTNQGTGQFTKSGSGYVPVAHPASCVGTTDACAGYNSDWAGVVKMVAMGDTKTGNAVTGDATNGYLISGKADLITVEKDTLGAYSLWLYRGGTARRLIAQGQISSGSWQNLDLIAPGDVNGDLLPDLWVRDISTGNLYQYLNGKDADGNEDPTVLGDYTKRTTIGTGTFTTAAYPGLASTGDRDGDGRADLYAAAPNGQLVGFAGQDTIGGKLPLGAAFPISTSGWGTSLASLEGFRTLWNAGYTPLQSPVRILDTRDGTGGIPVVPLSGAPAVLQVTGVNGVPADVSAVVLNLTGTNATGNTYLTAYADGQPRPAISNLSITKGQTTSNMAIVPVSNGKIDILNPGAPLDVVAELVGYISPNQGSLFTPATQARIMDTRDGTGGVPIKKIAGGTQDVLQVTGKNGVPDTASAVILNLTVANAETDSYLTVYADSQTRTVSSSLNYMTAQNQSNLVMVPVVNGKIDIWNRGGNVDVIVDLVGYSSSDQGSLFTPATPTRVMDTRDGTGSVPASPIGANATDVLQVAGKNGVPVNVTAVVLNVTVTNATEGGFLTLYPDGTTRPPIAHVTFNPGQTVSNLVIVPVINGKIAVWNHTGTVEAIADLVGYYH